MVDKKVKPPRDVRLHVDTGPFIRKWKMAALEDAYSELISLNGSIERIQLLATLSSDTDEDFGCGLDHVWQGFQELKDGLLGLLQEMK